MKPLSTFLARATLFGIGTTSPGATLAVNGTGSFSGLITFASGQTFPGTAELAEANTFTGNQTVNGNLSATGVVTGSSFNIGSNLFGFGSYANNSAFLGFAGNPANAPDGDTAVGEGALANDTEKGGSNAAVGFGALQFNTTGSSNTGVGYLAGFVTDGSNMTAGNNTFLGFNSSVITGTLTNATAIGANAAVAESNAMVLGCVIGTALCPAAVNVGIGTVVPGYPFEVDANVNGPLISTAGTGTDAAIGVNNTGSGGREYWIDSASSGSGLGSGKFGVYDATAGETRLVITSTGDVGIGTTSPDNLLSVNGSADKPGGGSWGTFSDRRLKSLDGSFSSGLNEVLKINPVKYRYKDDNGMGIRDREEHVGVVAQEIQKAIPEAVTENSKGYLLVNNDPILWAMLNAIKEQQGMIEKQKEMIQTQAGMMKTQAAAVKDQRALIGQQQEQIEAQREQMKTQQAQIKQLTRQVREVQAALKASSRTNAEINSVKAEVSVAHE